MVTNKPPIEVKLYGGVDSTQLPIIFRLKLGPICVNHE